MTPFSEHRLLRVQIEDVNRQRIAAGAAPVTSAANPTGKQTPRSIQQNAVDQNAHADTKGIRGVNPNADFIEANVRQNVSPDDWAAMTPEQQANHNEGMRLAEASNFTGTPGDTSTRTGQAGAMGKPGALGHNPNNPALSGGERPMGTAESDMRKLGILDPIQLSQARTADANERAANEKTAVNTAGSATPTKPGQSAGKQEKGAGVQGAAIDAVLAQLPPGYEFLGEAIKNEISTGNQQIANQEGLYNQSVADAEASNAKGQSVLQKLEQSITQTKDEMKGILDSIKKISEEQIAAEKKSADDQLVWYQQKREREIRGQMKADIEGRINELGFKGGFGSGNGLNAIREAEAGWEQQITDLGMEVGLARTDLAVKMQGMWNKVQESYVRDMATELKDYKKEMSNLKLAGLGLEEKKDEKRQKALETLVTNVTNIQTGVAKDITAQAKTMGDIINNERIRKLNETQQKKSDAFGFFQYAFSNSTDPALRQTAVDQMRAAGYTIPENVDLNADPVSFQLAAMQNTMKANQTSGSDPFRFTGEGASDKQALAASALTVIGQLEGGVDLNRSQLDYVNKLLDRGKVDEARTHLRGLAVAALKGPQENAYSARSTIQSASSALMKDLKEIQDTSKGQTLFNGLKEAGETLAGKDFKVLTADDFTPYNKMIQNLRKKLGVEGDPALQRIFAQVENIAGLVINERYGAAVTDGELSRAREYIAMSGNTLSEMIVKLDEYAKFTKLQNEMMLNTKMGLPSEDIDLGAPDVNSSPNVPSDDDFNGMFMQDDDSPATISTLDIGGRKVTGSEEALSALEMANREFFAATGQNLFVNSSYRSSEQQKQAYERYQRGEISRAAPPGKSLHEKGIAFDVTNWKEAEPYLIKYGFLPLPKNIRSSDPAHFSYKVVG